MGTSKMIGRNQYSVPNADVKVTISCFLSKACKEVKLRTILKTTEEEKLICYFILQVVMIVYWLWQVEINWQLRRNEQTHFDLDKFWKPGLPSNYFVCLSLCVWVFVFVCVHVYVSVCMFVCVCRVKRHMC